ncbi:MAG: helix-turn-helix transcriptional regulator [Proteobacteria bacterium]|nr:helix-turn-helix transcriptional regulator [Pseudomonadota bacterium]
MTVSSPAYVRVRTSDFLQHERCSPIWDQLEQVSRGRFEGNLEVVATDRVQLVAESWDRGLRFETAPGERRFLFSGAFSVWRPFRWCGHTIGHDAVAVAGPGRLARGFSADGRRWLLRVEQELLQACVAEFGLDLTALAQARARRVDPAALERWAGSVIWTLQRRRSGSERLLEADARARFERRTAYLLVETLGSALGTGRCPDAAPSTREAAVWHALTVARRSGARLRVPVLADRVGVSQRTLEASFREEFGVTPVRYLRVRRMNEARRELVTTAPGTGTVTAIATRHGFDELGRFSVEYRQLFGESPRETLREAPPPRLDPRPVEHAADGG